MLTSSQHLVGHEPFLGQEGPRSTTLLLRKTYGARERCTLISSIRICCCVCFSPVDFGLIPKYPLPVIRLPPFYSFPGLSHCCGYFWSLCKCASALCGEKWCRLFSIILKKNLLGNCAYRLNISIDACVTGTFGSKAWAKEQRSVQENMYFGREMLHGPFVSK